MDDFNSDCRRDMLAELDRLQAENERLRKMLREYGGHTEGCDAKFGEAYRCRCRWCEESAILASTEKEGK